LPEAASAPEKLARGGRRASKKEAAPAGGESGRRAHGPALGGEAGSVLIEAYLHRVLESTAGTRM
jgi:hypothetical protein